MIQLSSNSKSAAKTTAITLLGCGASSLITFIQLGLFGLNYSDLLMMNPLTSGYLHIGLGHLASNMIVLFLALRLGINQGYNALKIFYITIGMELIYLPLEILEISQIAIGISGTCYFLVSRYFFSWQQKAWLGNSIILLLATIELNGIFSQSDSSDFAHIVHLIGIGFGYTSLILDREKIKLQGA